MTCRFGETEKSSFSPSVCRWQSQLCQCCRPECFAASTSHGLVSASRKSAKLLLRVLWEKETMEGKTNERGLSFTSRFTLHRSNTNGFRLPFYFYYPIRCGLEERWLMFSSPFNRCPYLKYWVVEAGGDTCCYDARSTLLLGKRTRHVLWRWVWWRLKN